jgi:hypothetical protein
VGNDSSVEKSSKKPILVAIVLSVLALVSPILIQGRYFEIAYSIIVSSFLFGWGVNETSIWIRFVTEEHIQFAIILLLPRFAAPIQMYRYYNQQSTRASSALVVLFSESTGFLMAVPMMITSTMIGDFVIPTPLILVICILLLWLSPVPKPVTPWKEEEKEESTDWLENESSDTS